MSGGTTEGVAEMFRLPPSVEPLHDPSPARWVEEALAESPWATVRGNIPARYEAYARILHPASRHTGDTTWAPVRWAEVAARTGRTMHPFVQFERIAGLAEGTYDQPPWGIRPDAGAVCKIAWALTEILRSNTSTADRCVFGVWEGYGGMDMVPMIARAARARCPNRDYALFSGPIDGFFAFCSQPWEPPSIWWPEDKSWFVATEIDLDSTYVGGSRACIDAILRSPDLEAFPAGIDDPIHVGADEINKPFLAD